MLYVQHLRQLDYKHFELYAVGYAARKAFVLEKELKEEDLKTFYYMFIYRIYLSRYFFASVMISIV